MEGGGAQERPCCLLARGEASPTHCDRVASEVDRGGAGQPARHPRDAAGGRLSILLASFHSGAPVLSRQRNYVFC